MKTTQKVHAMSKEEMRAIRLDMRFSLRDLAAVTHIPYRTLQDYEGGQRPIPTRVAELLKVEQIKCRQIRAEVYAAIDEDMSKSYPNGVRPAS